MTIRNAYEACLTELNKVLAPAVLIDDFIYFFNKAVLQYYNKRYTLFETKQQLTDDLRVLTKTINITPVLVNTTTLQNVFGVSYNCQLPNDYVHLLNCICEFTDTKSKCCDGATFQQGANKLDTSKWSHIINNSYMKPSVKQPYYYIININDPTDTPNYPTEDAKKAKVSGGTYGDRYGNAVQPIMQIKCGNDLRYKLNKVYIDYLRAPEFVSLDKSMLDSVTDNSPMLEFPDYVVYEIINNVLYLLEENALNPRIQTSPAINTTIPQQ